MQSNSKKSMVKETRNVRARLSAMNGCVGVNQSRNLIRVAIIFFSRSTKGPLSVDNEIPFIISAFLFDICQPPAIPTPNMPPFIFVKAVSKECRQGFSEGCGVNGPIVPVVCDERQVNIGVWPLFNECKTVAIHFKEETISLCHPERSEGSLPAQRSFVALRMTILNRLRLTRNTSSLKWIAPCGCQEHASGTTLCLS